ncbi:MAG TPA: hypothetical protein DEG32_11955 [Balneolaceae bacterium]|nr:hypothetical protein [Balneolaceae bacterium]
MKKADTLNLDSSRFKQHKILALELNVPQFSITEFQDENFPLTFEVPTWNGKLVPIQVESDLSVQFGPKKKKGEFSQLYTLMYNIDTDFGAQQAFSFESNLYGAAKLDVLSKPSTTSELKDHLHSFSFDYTFNSIRVEWLPHLNILRYHCLSPAGHSVALKDYAISGERSSWDSRGVFRLDKRLFSEKTEQVLVVDNPLIADYLNSRDITAISMPSESELKHYDYPKLLADKKIYLCLGSYGKNYAFSMYPFVVTMLNNGGELYKINLRNALKNKSLPDWVHENTPSDIGNVLDEYSMRVYASDIPSQSVYNDGISEDFTMYFHPAQDFKNMSMIYSTESNDILFTNPSRLFPRDHVENMEGMTPNHVQVIESPLSNTYLEKIRNNDYLSPPVLYTQIRSFLKQFIYFRKDAYYDILTTWIICSYFYRIFNAYPYIHLAGEKGTGKTTVLDIVSKLAFNGFFLTKATPSTLIEQAHVHGSTLCVDEFEDYSSSRKSHDELSKFLNGGYNYRGSVTKRAGTKSTTYSTYCPKIFGGTGNIELETLKSRTIPLQTFKKPDHIDKDQFLEFDQQILSSMQLFEVSCYAIGIHKAEQIFNLSLSSFENITLPVSKSSLNNRQLELSRPLLAFAEFLDDETIKTSLLKGLDICWNQQAAFQDEREKKLFAMLHSYFSSTEPVKTANEPRHLVYEAEHVLEDAKIKKFMSSLSKSSSGKQIFNRLLADYFNIERKDLYLPEKGNTSCYLVPKSFLE